MAKFFHQMTIALQSKRFWAAVVTLLVVILNAFGLEVPEETLQNVVMVVAAWIVGDSLRSTPAALMHEELPEDVYIAVSRDEVGRS